MENPENNKVAGQVILKKGYTAPKSPTMANDGHRPASGQLGAPPTSGSVVSKPPVNKND